MSFLNSIIYKAPSPRTSSLPANQQQQRSATDASGHLVPESAAHRRLKRGDFDDGGSDSSLGRSIPVLPTPVSLTDFNISRTLGTGSFGRVHLVQHKMTGQFFAMKVLKKSEVVRLKQVEHIINEKTILEKTHHPFLVNMVATFQDAVNIYMVLEYVSGGEMFTYLRKFQVRPFSLCDGV
jgi:serine/threonine protein kinase